MDAAAWDARYAESERVWTATPNPLVASLLGDLPPGVAVDLAAGEGRHAVWLAGLGWDVTAVDFSAVGLARATATAREQGLDVEVAMADVRKWMPGAAVDLVLVAYLHLPRVEIEPLLSALPGWLAPGGTLLALGHDVANLEHGTGGPTDPDRLWSVELLRRTAARGLEVLRLEQVPRAVERAPRPALDVVLLARRPAGAQE